MTGKIMNNKEIIYIEKNPSPEEYNFIRKEVGWSGYNTAAIEKGFGNTLYSVCVYAGDNFIGMGRVIGDGIMVFYIQDIIVLPEFQNKKIGAAIMGKIMKYINTHSVNNTIIGLMSAKGKEDFYKKFGFCERPNEKHGCGMTQFYKTEIKLN